MCWAGEGGFLGCNGPAEGIWLGENFMSRVKWEESMQFFSNTVRF